MEKDVPIGFDSCSAHKFIKAIEDHPQKEEILPMVEPCESTCFSMYINKDGMFFPCSFAESGEGIDMTKEGFDFLKDVWYSSKTVEFRDNLLNNERNCPLYEI